MIDLSNTDSPGAAWHVMGELELSTNSHVNDTLTTWLTELLAQLDLNTDFLNEILKSAQDTFERVQQSDPARTAGYIHFSIFIRNNHILNESPWGFFQMEKSGSTKLDQEYPDHTIEFYLYQEGA